MAAKYAIAAGGNWTVNGSWSTISAKDASRVANTTAPTAADDVYLDSYSGNVTINAASVCRSIDCSDYSAGKTLTHNAFTLTVGDASSGAGNKALDFGGGFTYTLANATTSAISFQSSSATQQTINFNGKTSGNVTYGATAVSGNYILTGNHVTGAGATISLVKGTLDWGSGRSHTWGIFGYGTANIRGFNPNNSTVTIIGTGAAFFTSDARNLTVSANTGTVIMSVAGNVFRTDTTRDINFNGMSLQFTGGGTSGPDTGLSFTIANFTWTGTANKTGQCLISPNITCTGTFTITPNSVINRVLVYSTVVGTPRTITAAAISVNNTDFQDITGAGAATWDMSAGSVGDCGGNTMKALGTAAFTASATQTATGTASFTWSTHGWTSRVPLPQDDVVINNAFSASQTITADMPRLGRSIDFTGATGTPLFATGSLAVTLYGSLTLISGMTISGTSSITFGGRVDGLTLTSATRTFTQSLTFAAPSGTYSLVDDVSLLNFSLNNGTFTTNNFNVTANTFTTSGSNIPKTLNMGSSTFTLGSPTAPWSTFSGIIVNAGTSTIVLTNTGDTQKTFNGNGNTYNNLTITGRNVLITGSNTFNVLSDNTAGLAEGLYITAGTTQTVNSFLTNGSAGSLARLRSSTSGLYGGGITLNGTNMAYSAVDHADFRPAGNFSVMAVFRTSNTTAARKGFFQSLSANTNNAGININLETDFKPYFSSGKNTGSVAGTDYQFVKGSVVLNDGALHKLIGTYDGTKLHLYVDGTEVGTGIAWTNAAAFAATNYVRVGCQNWTGTNISWQNGMIDEIALWNGTALSAANVTTLQSSELADSAALLATATVYYPFNIGSETTDVISARNLTAIGTPTLTTNGILAKPTKHNTIDYTDIADTTFQGGTKWYASTHSVDSAGNTGISFTDEIPDGKGFMRLVR